MHPFEHKIGMITNTITLTHIKTKEITNFVISSYGQFCKHLDELHRTTYHACNITYKSTNKQTVGQTNERTNKRTSLDNDVLFRLIFHNNEMKHFVKNLSMLRRMLNFAYCYFCLLPIQDSTMLPGQQQVQHPFPLYQLYVFAVVIVFCDVAGAADIVVAAAVSTDVVGFGMPTDMFSCLLSSRWFLSILDLFQNSTEIKIG